MNDGVLCLVKPPGCSSHDVVGLVRRRLNVRAGHLGTLDPLAGGLLVVAAGRALKLVRYAGGFEKTYVTEIWLGRESPSHDLGEASRPGPDAAGITAAAAEQALAGVLRSGRQTPPLYSARQVAGQRAYRAARRGERLELPDRPVAVRAWRVLDFAAGRVARLRLQLRVSSGYYVRSLARDLGSALGTTGLVAVLVRGAVGGFALTEADPLEADWRLRAPARLVEHLAVREFTREEARRLCQGQRLPGAPAGTEPWRALCDGRLFGVVRSDDGIWRSETVLGLEA